MPRRPDIEAFVSTLRGAESIVDHWNLIRSWAARGELDKLVEAHALVRAEGDALAAPAWAVASVLDRIDRTLALSPGLAQAEAVLALHAGAPLAGRRVTQLGSLLGHGQGPDVFEAAAARHGDDEGARELLACWMFELVVRHGSLAASAGARRLRDALAAAGHPLAVLPLELAPLEAELGRHLPRYTGHASASFTRPDPPLGAIPRMGMTPALLRLGGAPPARLEALGTVVRGWVAESNGRLEVAVFELDPPLAEREVSSSLFAQLELHCLDTAAAIEARRAPAARAFAILFTCAAQGGAYGGARHGAYGRLDAWRSLAGFVGAGADAPLAELERHAVAAAWYDFGGATSWFHGSVWDLGLAALAPGGGSLAVLAATDVD